MSGERPLDSDLVAALRAGDPRALSDAYESYGGMVYGVALRLTGSEMEAEDVLQDVFVALPESLGQLRHPRAFRAWLERYAVRVALNHRRSSDRRLHFEARATETPRRRSETAPHLELEEAVRKLPRKVRTVFVLAAIQGFKHDEIADMLGITANASMQRLHRARLLLREMLADSGSAEP